MVTLDYNPSYSGAEIWRISEKSFQAKPRKTPSQPISYAWCSAHLSPGYVGDINKRISVQAGPGKN
jgi:hypothetical protein